MDEEKKENGKEQKTESKAEHESGVKVTIDKRTTDALWTLVEKVNDGFEAGKVHRQDVASWIIDRFLRNYTEIEVQLIRQSHYSDAVMLDATYRKMKESGEVPEFLRDALRKQFGVVIENKKSKKSVACDYINDIDQKKRGAS